MKSCPWSVPRTAGAQAGYLNGGCKITRNFEDIFSLRSSFYKLPLLCISTMLWENISPGYIHSASLNLCYFVWLEFFCLKSLRTKMFCFCSWESWQHRKGWSRCRVLVCHCRDIPRAMSVSNLLLPPCRDCRYSSWAYLSHRITATFKLENTFKIIQSNHPPITNIAHWLWPLLISLSRFTVWSEGGEWQITGSVWGCPSACYSTSQSKRVLTWKSAMGSCHSFLLLLQSVFHNCAVNSSRAMCD